MKIIKRAISFLIIAAVIISLSGCSFRFSSFDDLLRPPKLLGEYQGLQDSFEKAVGSGYTLCTPETGDYRSAFVTFDIDSDGDEEAFVFYISEKKPDTVSFLYFEFSDGNWIAAGSGEGAGSSVDKIMFSDLDRDGTFEIVIGWSLLSARNNKTFTSYVVRGEKIISMNSYPYAFLDLLDINGDGTDDIFSITIDSSVPENLAGYARVYNFNSQKLSLNILSEARTDGNVSSYTSVNTETVGDTNYVYVEALKGEHESITELLYWDDETSRIISPLFDNETQTTKFSWRNIPLNCYDINADGLLEIPTSVEMKGSSSIRDTESNDSNELVSDNLYFTKWVKYNNGKLKAVQYSVINSYFGYMLNIHSSWVGRITVVSVDGQWSFYRWVNSINEIGDLLFSIDVYSKNDNPSDADDFTELKSSGDKNYYFCITDAGRAFGITDKTIKDNFIITDFGGLK